MKQAAAKGSTAKHAGSHKHAGTSKHHPSKQPAGAKKAPARSVHTKAKHPAHAKARGAQRGTLEVLPPRSGAVAGPRQVPGVPLLAEWPCCAAEALGASLRVAGWPVAGADVLALHVAAGGSQERAVPILAALEAAAGCGLAGVRLSRFAPVDLRGLHLFRAGLVLGVELPGAHAVTVASDGCWLSWGEHCDPADFPGAVVEEAWAVVWP
jgi:hypothetical protein